jgi:CRP-like cAMP-binding protein
MKTVVKPGVQSGRINGAAYYRHLLSNRPHPLENLDALTAIVWFHRGQEICSEGQPVEYWYFLISGAARRCTIRPDGRRQIVDLLLPGDFFGLAFGDQSDSTIEAVAENTVVAGYPRPRIEILADSDPKIARELREIAFTALSRMQAQLPTADSWPHHCAGEGRFIHPGNGGASLERRFRASCPAGLALRHCRLSRRIGRDRKPGALGPQTARRNQIIGHTDGQYRPSRRP